LFVAQARFAQNTPAEALATRPALDCEGLERWRRSPRLPITESQDATECRILAAIREGSPLRLRYRSESQPGTEETRILTPCELLQVEGFPARYISGYCHTQEAFRTFRLDRIRVLA
jgi:predicted DNA-binding transcriptional regulator YafY